MSGAAVTIHTAYSFIVMDAVIEFYDVLFEFIVGIKNNLMTIEASLGSELIVGQIFRRRKLVTSMLENVPFSGQEGKASGMALVTSCLLRWMAFRLFPELCQLRMAFCTTPIVGCRVADIVSGKPCAGDDKNNQSGASYDSKLLFIFCNCHFFLSISSFFCDSL